jgi:hypothetical protein
MHRGHIRSNGIQTNLPSLASCAHPANFTPTDVSAGEFEKY